MRSQSQFYRKCVQFGFLAVTIWIGIEFILFVYQLENGLNVTVSRPPGVEAFLPIASLMSLKYWWLTGIFNEVHPSGLVLLLIILAVAIFLKKGFCSWVCPVGLLSEYLERVHVLLFDKPRKLVRWLDFPLRSIKYLLLFFFLWAILVQMGVPDLHHFLYSPYNKVADIKMLKFFSAMSGLTARVLIGLFLLSILFRHFWCRYLCPYGALLGALSWLSPWKINRNEKSCIDCKKCTKVCPAQVKVHQTKTVFSDECHACLRCVDVCPVENTLHFSLSQTKGRLSGKMYAVMIVLFFLLGTTIARGIGKWQNNITIDEYKHHIQRLHDPDYQHNRGQVPDYNTKHNNPNIPSDTKNNFRNLK